MKHRCMCGKPEGAVIRHEGWQGEGVLKFDNLLHFKSADRECERCGRPLCKDCSITVDREVESMFYKGLMVHVVDFLCPICAREVV